MIGVVKGFYGGRYSVSTAPIETVNVNEYLSHVLANIRASFASEYLNQITGLCY